MFNKLLAVLFAGCLILQPFAGTVVHADDDIKYKAELRINNKTELILKSKNFQYSINSGTDSDPNIITYYDDETVTYYDFDGPSGAGSSTFHIVLPDEDARYTISTASGKAEDLDFDIKYDDKYLQVSASAEGAVFSHDGALKLKGCTGELSLAFADDNAPVNQFNTYFVTGKNKGDVSVKITDKGAVVKGTDLKGLTITGEDAYDETNKDSYEIENSVISLKITREGNELVPQKIVTPAPTDEASDETPAPEQK